jgi:AcrR family transcriptional regulator
MPRASREPEILDAALACFAELGYDGTRVRHIAQRAGVSEAALYRHHPSKEAVALALFATHMRRYAQRLQEIADRRERPVADRVRAIARAALSARADDPVAHDFVLGHQGRFLGALPADFPYPIRILEALVREGQADGSVKPGPARVLAALVAGCMNQPAVIARHARPGTIDLADPAAVQLIADGAWAAIAARAGRAA